MVKLYLKQIYHRLIQKSIRIRFKSFRRSWRQELYRKYINLYDKNIRRMSERINTFCGSFYGQRCFIMGNGPSLNRMDLSLFQNEIVWCSNRSYLLFDRIMWRPKFYVAVDTRVVPDNASEINKLSKQLPDSNFFFPVEFRYKGILKSAENVYWYNEIQLSEENLPDSMFSINPPDFVYSTRTVTIAMLQLAVYLGFNPIYLIGCDTSYTIPKTVQYENGNKELIISTEADPNHFDSSYFGMGKKWHDPHVDRMIFNYEQARKVCDRLGVQIINATIGGDLAVFPRKNYLELF